MTEYNLTCEEAVIAMRMGAICDSQGVYYKALRNGKFKRRVRIRSCPKTFKWIVVNYEPCNPIFKWRIVDFINCSVKSSKQEFNCLTHKGYIMTNSSLVHYDDRKKLSDLMLSCCINQTIKTIKEKNNE